jgi:hypothetical protein
MNYPYSDPNQCPWTSEWADNHRWLYEPEEEENGEDDDADDE